MTEDLRRVLTFGMAAMIVAVLIRVIFSRENRRIPAIEDYEHEEEFDRPSSFWATFFGTMIGSIFGCTAAGVVIAFLIRYLP